MPPWKQVQPELVPEPGRRKGTGLSRPPLRLPIERHKPPRAVHGPVPKRRDTTAGRGPRRASTNYIYNHTTHNHTPHNRTAAQPHVPDHRFLRDNGDQMLLSTMSKMMEAMAPSSVNGLEPEKPARTDGLAESVYDQMRQEFFVAGPFVLHGEVPPLLAGAWALVRETLFCGHADRGRKEIIASAVSEANSCPFCVDAHGAAVAASGASDAALAAWARATGEQAAIAELGAQPVAEFAEHRAEYLGTVTAFHYLNRMVSVFLDEKMMPMPDALNGVTQAMAKVMMGGMITKAEHLEPGRSVPALAGYDHALAWKPSWAASSPNIADALAGWSATAEAEAQHRFDAAILTSVGDRIGVWTGGATIDGPDLDSYLSGLDDGHRHSAELAVLTCEAAHRITPRQVEAVTNSHGREGALALVAWAASRAAQRCAEWTADATGS